MQITSYAGYSSAVQEYFFPLSLGKIDDVLEYPKLRRQTTPEIYCIDKEMTLAEILSVIQAEPMNCVCDASAHTFFFSISLADSLPSLIPRILPVALRGLAARG